jgi:hypothetical protein
VKVINGRRGALKKFALTAATSAIDPASAAAEPALTPPDVLYGTLSLRVPGARRQGGVWSGEFEIRSPRMNYVFSQLSRRVSFGGTAHPIWQRFHEAKPQENYRPTRFASCCDYRSWRVGRQHPLT